MVWDAEWCEEDNPKYRGEDEMPNWDCDDDFNEDDVPQPVRENIRRRASILRTPETRKQKTWNGNPVSGMESDHLMNAILFCEKRFVEASHNHQACFYGQNPSPSFYFKDVFDMFPDYVNLRDEWDKRMESR